MKTDDYEFYKDSFDILDNDYALWMKEKTNLLIKDLYSGICGSQIGEISGVKGKDKLESVEIKNENGKSKILQTDYVVGFFGLIMQLGPILDWGLNIDKKTISVNTENFETNKKGIFAIGDICTYPGKLKLILSGFHEGALAARGCFKYARPSEKYRFEFTTASKTVKERLGVKE